MKFVSPLIVVSDMERSKLFYSKVLGLDVELDFGENVTLTGGIVLQTKDSWPTLMILGLLLYINQKMKFSLVQITANCILKKMILITLY